MNSMIARELNMTLGPVAISFTNEKPAGALQYEEGQRGCVIARLTDAANGRIAVFDRKTVGCTGGIAGLGFGSAYDGMPGGIEYFLSTGRGPGYPEGEAYKKTPELAKSLIESMPMTNIPYEYVVFSPLASVPEGAEPVVVCFYATVEQLAALVVLANYGRPGNDNVTIPMASGCSTVCLLPYTEGKRETPRGVVGCMDISARPHLPNNVLTFSVPFAMFKEMEGNVEGSFLQRSAWAKVKSRLAE